MKRDGISVVVHCLFLFVVGDPLFKSLALAYVIVTTVFHKFRQALGCILKTVCVLLLLDTAQFIICRHPTI